ncbi:MFS transporter [Saccharothrix sp. S26]|uniref:MFS transporter n=1 Tax=Saccharothrix sp. S26 TaxID=2907215 RepID=UPI001F3377C3|nr:MFS transporter [Saccharothrix sp. S26]MCE6995511.1 MFS transporter [Saccharothrix sp. S26]
MTDHRDRVKPAPIPGRTWGIAAVTGSGAFMAMLDSTVVSLAVESVRADFDSTLPVVQWTLTGYLLALAVSLPASAWLGARHGHGRVWAVAVAVFVAASALCALAGSAAVLVAARVAQGLAGGVMVPAGQAVVGLVARPDQLGRLFSAVGAVISLGQALGPAVGGLLVETLSWRWVFWLNVPVGLAVLALAPRLVPGGQRDRNRRLDLVGMLALTPGLALLLYGATEIGTGTSTTLPALAVIAGGALTAGFTRHAARATTPLLDLALLRHPTFATATATAGLTGAAMHAGLLALPLALHSRTGTGITTIGMLLLAMGAGTAAALYLAGSATDRWGAGPVTVTGAVLLTASTAPLILLDRLPLPILVVDLVLRGAALAWTQMPAVTAAYTTVTAERMGDATTLVNIVQRVGGALGTATIAVILSRMSPDGHIWAFGAVTVMSAAAIASSGALHQATTRCSAND